MNDAVCICRVIHSSISFFQLYQGACWKVFFPCLLISKFLKRTIFVSYIVLFLIISFNKKKEKEELIHVMHLRVQIKYIYNNASFVHEL